LSDSTGSRLDTGVRIWDLSFRDQALEKRYRESYFDNDLHKTRVGLVAGILVLLVFAILEPYLLQTPALVNQVRLLFVMPVILLCLVASFTMRAYFHLLVAGSSVLVILSQISILLILGADTATNTSMAYIQHVLGITVLLFQPFRYLVLPVVALTVLMTAGLKSVGNGSLQVANYELAVQGVSFIALLFAYLRERSQRQLFAASVEVNLLRVETERQQANQIHWLRNLSRYLEHELRNHVFIAQSNLEFLQQDIDAEQVPVVNRALRSVEKLGDLCDSVGEASNLETALRLEQKYPVNFSAMVVERVLERSRDLDEANPLELDVDPDLWVHGSESRLMQVFDHLLNNAIEYASEDAHVRIEVKSLVGDVLFTVHNRGEILHEERDVFAAFETTQPKSSLGMGLYVSRKIIEHHDGSIEAQTRLGQTFVVVSLPRIEAPASATQPPANNVMDFSRLMKRSDPR